MISTFPRFPQRDDCYDFNPEAHTPIGCNLGSRSKERVESQIRTGMSRGEVRGILGEPTLRRSHISAGAEWEPLSERRLYSECWYWGQDATVCFGQDRGYGVVYKHAASDSAPR